MSSSFGLPTEMVAYLAASNPPEHPAMLQCRLETAKLGDVSNMQISLEQAAFMSALTRLTRAERAFEVGVFTGYSALAVALAMHEMHADNAYLLACDVSEDWTARALGYWRDAGVDEIIDLQLRPANETLDEWIENDESGSFDFGFVDADKFGYDGYYERGLELLRPGGVMLFDNMFWGGAVVDINDQSPDTRSIRELAMKARSDNRVYAAMLNVGDGLLMVAKK